MTLTPTDFWRAIALYGLNTATYKIALGQVLVELAKHGVQDVNMTEVAGAFFHTYRTRLQSNKPQQSIPGRQTYLERVVADYNAERLTEADAISRVERGGFNDVVRRFHVVNRQETQMHFYQWQGSRITHLTDDLLRLFENDEATMLLDELHSRWDLLEVAFSTGLPASTLDADERTFFQRDGPRRTTITGTRPVLNGYQNGRCFYCGEPLNDDVEVDHVLPWSALYHDQIWNLVLACYDCNRDKSALLPLRVSLDNLLRRNEYYIASNHPIKTRLIQQMGQTVQQRAAFLERKYRDAETVKLHVWKGRQVVTPDPLRPFHLVQDTPGSAL